MKVDILLSIEIAEEETPDNIAQDAAFGVAYCMKREVWGSVADGIEFDPFVRNRVKHHGYDRYGLRIEERRRVLE